MNETITVTIEQRLGAMHRYAQCKSDELSTSKESQEHIGFVVGQAVRGIIAQQNCGCEALFWLGFLREIQHTGLGGEWAQALYKAAAHWWEKAGDEDGSFDDAMKESGSHP